MKWNAPGLTTGLLAQHFYPHYDFALAASSSPTPVPQKKKKKPAAPGQRILAGMRRGTRVDARVKVLLELKRQFRIPERECGVVEDRTIKKRRVTKDECMSVVLQYTPEAWLHLYDPKTLTAAAVKYQKLIHTRDNHSRLLFSYWNKHGFRVVATQVSCGIRGVCATRADAVLLDDDNRLVIAEIKSGYDYLHSHTPHSMAYPWTDQNDSPLHQFFLQLAFTCELYCATYPHLESRMATPRVFRVTPTLVESYPLPSWASGRMVEALAVLRRRPTVPATPAAPHSGSATWKR